MRLFTFLLLFQSINSFPQSLTIDETIKYLNKFSKEQPYSFRSLSGNECNYSGHYQFSIDKEGVVTIHSISSKSNCKNNEASYTDVKTIWSKFYIQDLNLEKIKEYNSFTQEDEVKIECRLNDRCITQTFLPNNREEVQKTSWIGISTSDRYNRNKLYNALVYLFSLAIDKGYVRNDVGDPFAKRNEKEVPNSEKKTATNNKTATKPKTNTSTESRITLKREGGVFSLTVNVNGVPTKFILDSGAGECNISSETERKLIANGVINQKDYLINGLYRIADGSIVENRRVKIPKITVGKKTVYNVIASVGPSVSPNLLGQSFLRKLDQWSIDNTNEVLIIK